MRRVSEATPNSEEFAATLRFVTEQGVTVSMRMPRNDIAIYTTSSLSAGLYDRARARAGGAERQMTLLAQALSSGRRRVAHIVYPPEEPIAIPNKNLVLVHRAAYVGDLRFGAVREAARFWHALKVADARVTIIRAGSPIVGVAACFCKLHGRALIFSTANNSEFMFETRGNDRYRRLLYRLGVRLADAIVVQSEDQVLLARTAFPQARSVIKIPSFAEIPSPSEEPREDASAFIWVGRLVDYKRPMHYVELARAVPEARFVMIPVPQKPDSSDLEELMAVARDVPNLEFLEPVPHSRLMNLLAGSVAVVNTAWLEGMPNAFLEAWVSGVPVLTFEFDPDRVVTTLELGVAAEGSWERFVAGARSLWLGRANRDEFASRARAYVEKTHSPEKVGSLWNDLIEKVAPGA
jgi:glycosyltransferase involved in cell wall biosynthesis